MKSTSRASVLHPCLNALCLITVGKTFARRVQCFCCSIFLSTAAVARCPGRCRFLCDKAAVLGDTIKEILCRFWRYHIRYCVCEGKGAVLKLCCFAVMLSSRLRSQIHRAGIKNPWLVSDHNAFISHT